MYNAIFYCDTSGIAGTDVSRVLEGNPGIGGAQYLNILIATMLNKKLKESKSNCTVKLCVTSPFSNVCSWTPIAEVGSFEECIKEYGREDSIFIIREFEAKRQISYIKNSKQKCLIWAHNTIDIELQRIICQLNEIVGVVCVSRQQYMNMSYLPFFEHCCFINNCYPENFFSNDITDYTGNKVVYIGAAVPQKGMHNVLDIWKYVEKEIPTAKLELFGGVHLRDNRGKLGSLGVTAPTYERILNLRMRHLNKNNICFRGVCNWDEIKKSLLTANIGIVNPSFLMRDETFCLAAVEMESMGLPVVSRERNDGLQTTVLNHVTGILQRNNEDISNAMVEVLKNKELNREMGKRAKKFASSFIAETAIERWNETLERFSMCDLWTVPYSAKYLLNKETIYLAKDKGLQIMGNLIMKL